MYKLANFLKSLIYILILIMGSFMTAPGVCQELVVSSGTGFIGSGGSVVLRGNLTNNGSLTSYGTVVLSGSTQSIDGDIPAQFNNLTISSASTTTMVTPGQTISGVLLCNGVLNAGGNLTLLSTESATALIDGSGAGHVLGDLSMQRYLPSAFGYKYFSSPFQAATVGEFGDDMDLGAAFTTFYRYDENRLISGTPASGWVGYKIPDNLLIPMTGYAVNFGSRSDPATVDVTGVVNNGDLSVTLYNNNQIYTKGFNLVGNPYPSPVDWDAAEGWERINIDDALYYFGAGTTDQYGGTYRTYMNGVSSDGLATGVIPSMQGFFVHVADGSYPVTGTLGMTNKVRITNLTHPFIKSDAKGDKSYIRLVAGYSGDSTSFDPLVIYFDEKATLNFDGQHDALKLYNTDAKVTNFYSFGEDGSRLSINALPLVDENLCTVRLGIKTEKDGEVVFRIKHIEGDFFYKTISISDVISGTEQELDSGSEYRVFLEAGHYQERFYLNLVNIPTGIPDNPGTVSEYINIYSFRGILKAEIDDPSFKNGILTIYNLMGQALYKYNIYEPGYHEFSPAIKDGIYIIAFNSGNRRITKKLFIKSR